MGSLCRRFIGRGLLVASLLSLSAFGVFGAPAEYTWYYSGTDDNITVFGETLDQPELTLSGESISFDDDTPAGSWGYGVFFEYTGDASDAMVLLNSSSSINVSFITDDDVDAYMQGIRLDGFIESHVSLLGKSEINVTAQGTNAESYGIEISNTSGIETAEMLIDEGSALTVKATAIDDSYADAEAGGIYLEDNVHAVVNIDNGSTVTVEAKATVTPETGSSSSADAYSEGIYVDYSDLVDLKLAGGSSLIVNATAETDTDVDGSTGATSLGIEAYGDTVNVDLLEGSTVIAEANAEDEATSSAINAGGEIVTVNLLEGSTVVAEANAEDEATSNAIRVGYSADSENVNHGEITLDGESKVSAIATANGGDRFDSSAESNGVDLSAEGDLTAILAVKNGSSITATATATEESYATAVYIHDSPHAVINIESGSTLSATATAIDQNVVSDEDDEADANAFASALFLEDVGDADINLTDATLSTTVTATATQLGETGEAGAYLDSKRETPGGLWLSGYDSATVALQNTSITVAGATTASGGNESSADGWMLGINLEDSDGSTQLSLIQSDIDVQVTATAEDNASAGSIGIVLNNLNGEENTVQLTDSTVSVSATATVTKAGATAEAQAYGIAAVDSDAYTINLNHSTVSAVGKVSGNIDSDNDSFVAGLWTETEEVAVNLTNGSLISSSLTRAEGLGDIALYIEANTSAEVNIDATSAISGTWALYDDGESTTLNNAGTVAGRIQAATLNSASTGVLQATFGVEDTESDDDGINYFKEFSLDTSASGEYEYYYFRTGTTTLANGTTFLIAPTDNLGLTEEGDSATYALLSSETEVSDWDQEQLKLTSTFQSSLFDMSWDESSDANTLNVKFTFLTPEQAGLSRNGTAAYQAAVKDGVFSFTTDPEEWVPNVSGASVSGMANTRRISHLNIGNRMSALMGMNSGDEVIASNSLWTSVRYTDSEQDDRNSTSGFDSDTTSFSIGIDREFNNATLGFAYTLGSSDADIKGSRDDFDMTDHLFSLYGSYDGGAWYSDAILSVGFGNVEGKRYVGSDVYKSDYDNNSYHAKVEVGMKFNQQGWQLNPLLAMQYSTVDYDSYTEKGSGDLALHVKSEEYDTFTTGLGANVLKDFQQSWGILTPEFGGMLNYDLKNDRIVSTANFTGGNTSFVSKGIKPSETSWDVGTALTIAGRCKYHVSFRISYDYSGRKDFAAHSVAGKLRFEF